MTETPQLSTKRLILSPYTIDRVTQTHVDWLSDPEVVRYSEQRHLYHSLETQALYIAHKYRRGSRLWVISLKDGTEIGTIGVDIDRENQVGDMGILIGAKDVWRKGYASEAWAAVMDWCFKVLKLRKLECGTMLANIGMRKAAVKCGMEPEGARLAHFLLDGETQDLLLYGKKAK